MEGRVLEGAFTVTQAGAAATVSLMSKGSPGQQVAVSGYRGPVLPPLIHDPRLQETGEPADGHSWCISCGEGEFRFSARSVEHHEPLPRLFDPLLDGFALRARDRTVVRVLLRLLRLPGGAWLMRAWHASRG